MRIFVKRLKEVLDTEKRSGRELAYEHFRNIIDYFDYERDILGEVD
jgi:hypothetical protein